MANETFVHALAYAATVFAQARGRKDQFQPNKRRDLPSMYPVSQPTPAPPLRMICRACDVISTDENCWSCDGPMEEIPLQTSNYARLAGCQSDDYAGVRSYVTPREPKHVP